MGEPWNNNEQWGNGNIRSDVGSKMRTLIIFAILWNALSLPATLNILKIIEKNGIVGGVVIVFPLSGIFLAVLAILNISQWMKFGTLTLVMDPFPGSLGGDVGGTIDLPIGVGGVDQRYDVTVSCVHSYVTGSGKEKKTYEKLLWQKVAAASAEPGPGGTRLRFRVPVPGDLPASEPESSNYHKWVVRVQADLPGRDLDSEFIIPVYLTGVSSAADTSSQAATPYSMSIAELAAAGVRVGTIPEGVGLHFPWQRQIKESIMVLLMVAFMSSMFYLMFQDVPLIGIGFIDFFLKDLILFVTLLFSIIALSGLFLFMNTWLTKVSADRVEVTRTFLGINILQKKVLISNISSIRLKKTFHWGSSTGGKSVFAIIAELKDGRELRLGDGIKGILAAEALSNLLERKFGLPLAKEYRVIPSGF